jgi:HAMP domain-containing protein
MVIANLFAAFFVGKEPEKTLWVLLGLNLLFTAIFIGGYIIRATSKLELTKNEVEPQVIAKEMKKIKRIGIFMGIYFAGVYYFLNALLSVMLNEGSFFTSIVEKGNIIGSVVSGVLFGGAMYLLSKSRLKKVEDL